MKQIDIYKINNNIPRIKNIKNIIPVSSGKGGVGKSTIAVNLAVALGKIYSVGILDADIYGPSVPMLVGATDYQPNIADNMFVPLKKFNIKIMSFGFLVDANQATIWRGILVNKALKQLLYNTLWDDLDILIIDLPPGTGDVQLNIAQNMPITATITVTTPQDIALLDVGKSVAMFEKLNIPCLGIIENMSYYQCKSCLNKTAVFDGKGNMFNLEVLGKLPLDEFICKNSDDGIPIANTNNPIAEVFLQIAENTVASLSKCKIEKNNKIPIQKL